MSFREFVMVTHILFDGNEDEKLDCESNLFRRIFFQLYLIGILTLLDLFKLYDADGDGYLSAEEVGQLMSASIRSLKLVVKSFGDPTLASWDAKVTRDAQAKEMTEKFLSGMGIASLCGYMCLFS